MTSLAVDAGGFPVLQGPRKPPPAPDDLELARRRDAVREAAREFESLSSQDLLERLKGTTTRDLTPAEISQFGADVHQQVLDDLVDVIDQNTRGVLRRRRTVRVAAPKGYRVMTIKGLSADELVNVRDRLAARGWSHVDLDRSLPISEPPPGLSG